MKNGIKIGIIMAVLCSFLFFDLWIYQNITTRYMRDTSDTLKAKSIELSEYLPFEKETKAICVQTDFKLKEDLPKLDGAAALYPVFSSIVGSVYPESSVSFNGTDFDSESFLQMNNTREAYKNIVDGDVDVIFCAGANEEQLNYAKAKNVELEFVPIGKEAFVFFVNENNPVNTLSSKQIRDIYAGRIKNWKEVGGKDALISPLSRNQGSGSQTTMEKFMGEEKIAKDYDAILGKSIAFSFRYYVEELTHYGKIKILNVDGITPSKENIKNDSYPLSSYFYAIYRKDNTNKNIPKLIDWIQSKEGQELIEKNGYVSRN
ncbi:MAG: substrate-binding domain-containing protein [Firmicutes bacterium]|nr:substrate-binding domain-containing protein [Bacillota bacterium]